MRKRFILWVLALIVLALLVWGVRWATYARPPLQEAVDALDSDENVIVTYDPWLAFSPAQSMPTVGFIFYPGGRINPQGYAPLLRAIAAEGYLVVTPEMPINMAIFDADAADEIIAAHPEIEHWVIGGHSVGGTAAALYVSNNPQAMDGLVIWASYPADSSDLASYDLPVALIYGSEDPRVNDASVAERKLLLPPDTTYARIDGGDHHQFGSYVIEPEEHHALIPAEDQQAIIVEETVRVLQLTD